VYLQQRSWLGAIVSAKSEGANHVALLAILSVIAGLVDVTGFFCLGHVFTAHITGNLVMMAVQIVDGGPPHVAQLLSIPVFGLTVVVAYFLARRARVTRGRGALLVGQSLMLFLILGLVFGTRHRGALASTDSVVGAMIAVAAMAFQNAFVRVSLHESSTTSVMTGNVASLLIGLLALVWPGPWARDEAANKVRSTLPVAVGFFVGCAVGAASVSRLGLWAFILPALLSLVAIPIGATAPAAPAAQRIAGPI
jgi:uncharacterized membrane protein YoaK (UPF0700 family)